MNTDFHNSKHGAIFILTLLCAGVIVAYPLFDYDLYWHLANGRAMLAQQQIVNTEIFSYTRAGTPFVNHEWLAQILLFWIYQHWGGFGLNVFKVLMAVLTTAVLYRTCRNVGANPYITSFLTLGGVLVCIARFNVRPELFSLLYLALLGYIVHSYFHHRISQRALYFLPVIMLLWDWLHGAVYGVALLSAFVAAENFKHWLSKRRDLQNPTTDRISNLNIWFAVAALVMLLNPYGLLSYDIFLEFFRDNPLAQRVGEFLPPTWATNTPFWVFLGTSGLIVAASYKRVDITHLALLLPFAALALRYERATAIFALVATPLVAMLIPKLLDDMKTMRFGPPLRLAISLCAVAVLSSYIIYVKLDTTQQIGLGFRVVESGLPVGTARFIQGQNLLGNMYNPGHFGGYLAFALAPQFQIFQYNHHTVFGDTLRYLDHPEQLDAWKINYAVVTDAREIQVLFPPGQWAPLYQENGALLVMRRAPENADVIRDYETLYYQPYRYSFDDFRRLATDPRIYPRLMYEMSTYLVYRRDQRVSALFAELLSPGANAYQALPVGQRAYLALRALRYNSDTDNLRQLAQQR